MWNVSNTLTDQTGRPYVLLGNHGRRYQVTPSCDSAAACRFSAVTFDTSNGKRLGTIVFKWDGSAYKYAGAATWYRDQGGSTCQLPGGDLLEKAYTTHEQVSVTTVFDTRPVGNLRGTKTVSGTPTAIGVANGCEPYSMTFDVVMTAT